MNNLLLDTLRQQQPMQGGQPPAMGMPIQQGLEQMPQQEPQVFNPFNKGITAAMQSARESLGASDEQKNRALRGGILGFARKNLEQPKQRGFWNNFVSSAPGLIEGIAGYDQGEAAAEAENFALAKEIADRENYEKEQMARATQQAWNNDFHERQLGEQVRAHDLAYSAHTRGVGGAGLGAGIDASRFSPITSKPEMARYSKKKTELGAVRHELGELAKDYEDFRKKHAKDIIDPMGGYGGAKVLANSLLGRFAGSEAARKEKAEYDLVKSRQNKFVASAEKALKGGVLGPRTIELFAKQGIYPDVEKDTPESYEAKLKMIVDELDKNYKAADYSLKYGVNIDPSDVGQFESLISPQRANNNPPAMAAAQQRYFRLPTGQRIGIPIDHEQEIQEAIQDGLVEE